MLSAFSFLVCVALQLFSFAAIYNRARLEFSTGHQEKPLHEGLPRTILYDKTCTNISQYYFVLEDLHKISPESED